eukprot:3918868-Amphidinium_carterae.1
MLDTYWSPLCGQSVFTDCAIVFKLATMKSVRMKPLFCGEGFGDDSQINAVEAYLYMYLFSMPLAG